MISTQSQKIITRIALIMTLLGALVTATTLADDFMYVTAYHLNVRAEGTFRSGIIATVDSGYKVVIMETLSNGWDKVLLENGQVGYVNARYLSTSEPYFEKALGSEYEVSVPSAFVRADGLQKKIAVLHRGDRLEVLDQKVFLQKWIRVRVASSEKDGYIGRVGYISKKLVQVIDGTQYPEEVSALNSAPSEDATADWIGGGNEMTFNSAPQDPSMGSGANMDEFLRALWNINAQTNTGVVHTGALDTTGNTNTGNIDDFLGGLLGDTNNSTVNTGSVSTTASTGATADTGATNTASGIDSLFGSLLN